MLEPMTNDPVNYVRQGALIASALIMIQQTEILCPKVSDGPSAREVCKKNDHWLPEPKLPPLARSVVVVWRAVFLEKCSLVNIENLIL